MKAGDCGDSCPRPQRRRHQRDPAWVAICVRSSRSPCALRVLSRRVRRMTPKRRKRRGESVPSPEQDKAEVVRAVLTRREIGVVTSAAAETARDHRHATLLPWPGGRNPTATHFYSAGGSRCGIPHGDVIVSEGSGDEVLRGEDVVAHKPVSTNCPPPLRPGPASNSLLMHASPR